MSDQHVDFSLVLLDHRLSLLLGKAKLPIKELWPFADSKHRQTIDLYSFEVQKVANTLELLPFLLSF